jgi:hypothetical protein
MSIILSLAGDRLAPWTAVKSAQLQTTVAALLAESGIAVSSFSTQLLWVQGNSSSGASDGSPGDVAAIPSLYSINEAGIVRASVLCQTAAPCLTAAGSLRAAHRWC